MSYDNNTAHMDLDEIISQAVREDDDETLYKWANYMADKDPELAEQLKALARKADDNNWAHDRSKND